MLNLRNIARENLTGWATAFYLQLASESNRLLVLIIQCSMLSLQLSFLLDFTALNIFSDSWLN